MKRLKTQILLTILALAIGLYSFSLPIANASNAVFYSTVSDGEINWHSEEDYNTVWASQTGIVCNTTTSGEIGQSFLEHEYAIYRYFLFFDTSSLPDDIVINSATLSLWGLFDFSDIDFNITIQNGQPTYPHIPLQTGDYAKDNYTGNGGQFDTSEFVIDAYNNIVLNSDGRNWINNTGITKLCIRSDRDIAGIESTIREFVYVYCNEWGRSEAQPKLTIIYRIEGGSAGKGHAPPSYPPPFGWRPFEIALLSGILIVGFIFIVPTVILFVRFNSRKVLHARVYEKPKQIVKTLEGKLKWKKED